MNPPCSPGDASLPGLLTLYFSAAGSALATDGIWVGTRAQTYGNANWGGVNNRTGGVVADGSGAGAYFTNTFINGHNVFNNSARMIGKIVFTDPANLTDLTVALNPLKNYNLTHTVSGFPRFRLVNATLDLVTNPL